VPGRDRREEQRAGERAEHDHGHPQGLHDAGIVSK
jgi:hypothetical protein